MDGPRSHYDNPAVVDTVHGAKVLEALVLLYFDRSCA